MTSITQSDPVARHHAAAMFGDRRIDGFSITFERYVNSNDVPVRRLVLVGPEEVDGAALNERAA